ncbi:hypothetical protein ACLGL2_03575 [Parvimonas sp. G1641]|uniref:hypothetical protein n=1 Tax=Parvimonas sp. G1641 TaxID=3388846 RepID=UPI00397FB29A
MALSGNFSGSYRGYTLRTEWKATQNTNENYSDLEITLHLDCQSGYNLYIGQRTHTVNIAGTEYSITSSSISTNGGSSITLGSISKRLYHNNDGTLDVWISSYCNLSARIRGTYVSGFSGGSDTITLDKIPRMSTISDTMDGTRYLNTPHTIHIEKQLSGNVTHTVWYVIRGDKGSSGWYYIAKNTSDLDIQFVPTDKHVNLQPDSSTIFMDIGIKTFKDGVQIGETTYNSGWYMKVPDEYSPTIDSIDILDGNLKSKTLGVYVQNHSKLKVNTKSTSKEGATIKNISVIVDKNTYSGQDITTKEITQTGNIEIDIKVTDSRGKTASEKRTIKVEPYDPPKIINFSADRTEADEKVVKLIYSFKMSSIATKNPCNWKIERRPRGSSTWSTVKAGTEKSLNSNTLTYNITTDREYEFKLTISDFNTSNESITYVYTSFVLFDFHKDGKGMAIGRSSILNNLFDVDILTKFRNEVEFEKSIKKKVIEAQLKNSWNNLPGEYNKLSFYKDINGNVHLQGIVTGGVTKWGTVIFTLPEQYRPKRQFFGDVILDDYSLGIARIEPNGDVIRTFGDESQWRKWACFDKITFPVEN